MTPGSRTFTMRAGQSRLILAALVMSALAACGAPAKYEALDSGGVDTPAMGSGGAPGHSDAGTDIAPGSGGTVAMGTGGRGSGGGDVMGGAGGDGRGGSGGSGATTDVAGSGGASGAAGTYDGGAGGTGNPSLGITCNKPGDCPSGFCVDGVCCESAQTGFSRTALISRVITRRRVFFMC